MSRILSLFVSFSFDKNHPKKNRLYRSRYTRKAVHLAIQNQMTRCATRTWQTPRRKNELRRSSERVSEYLCVSCTNERRSGVWCDILFVIVRSHWAGCLCSARNQSISVNISIDFFRSMPLCVHSRKNRRRHTSHIRIQWKVSGTQRPHKMPVMKPRIASILGESFRRREKQGYLRYKKKKALPSNVESCRTHSNNELNHTTVNGVISVHLALRSGPHHSHISDVLA